MDRIAKLIFLLSLAITMALVLGKQDDDPLRNLFGGAARPNVWPPLMKWGRAGPPNPRADSASEEYEVEYGGQPDAEMGGNPLLSIVKRSHSRQPACEVLLNIVYVGNGTDGYEYRPNHYVTETCLGSYNNNYQNKCTETGLSCTQIRQKLYITRRKLTPADSQPTNCWEHVALREIDFSCECMWPKEHHGDKHTFGMGK